MKRMFLLGLLLGGCAGPGPGPGTLAAGEPPGTPAPVPAGQGWFHFDAPTYLPSRVLDLLDVVRADLGAGLGTGLVLRVTPWAQVGWRRMTPVMLRVGLRGRRAPILLEQGGGTILGPGAEIDAERSPTPGEIGAGVDLVFGGAYVGLCLDELLDLALGFLALDFKRDDLGR